MAGIAAIMNLIGSSAANGESVAELTTAANPAQAPEENAIFRGNLQRHGYYPDEQLPDEIGLEW